jgi:hypothetical protein
MDDAENSLAMMAKLNGSIPLPKDFVASAIYQTRRGRRLKPFTRRPPRKPSCQLVVRLAGGARSVNIPLIRPTNVRRTDPPRRSAPHQELRWKQGTAASQPDAYNAFNRGGAGDQQHLGAVWRTPTQILDPRLFKSAASCPSDLGETGRAVAKPAGRSCSQLLPWEE